MTKLGLTLMALATAIIVASVCGRNVSAQGCPGGATSCFAVPISGLPSVSVNPDAALTPGEPTSLGSLITYNPGINTQCNFLSIPDRFFLGTGPCSIAYSVFAIDPNTSHYSISGAWVNPTFGTLEAAIGGADPNGVLPNYTGITLTANTGSGAASISGLINPQTTTWSYGPISWSGTVQIG